MKLIIKIIILLYITFSILNVNGGYVTIPDNGVIKANSIQSTSINGNLVDSVNSVGFNILKSVKLIIQALAVLFVVYIGIQMIISTGTDDEELSSAKKQIYYTVIGLAFISMPSIIFDAFTPTRNTSLTSYNSGVSWTVNGDYNIFFNVFSFGYTLNNNIIGFIEVLIGGIAILILSYAGLKMMTSRGRDEKISEGKNKIRYSVLALLFIGFIESWKYFVFSGKIDDGTTIFKTLSNLALFFVGPTVILFLTIAGYYYITSNGDDDRIKKAKTIIVNVLIAIVLLLAAYTFLNDLRSLNI